MKNAAKVINFFHRIVEFLAKIFFQFISNFNGPREYLPPIKDQTLMQSASTLASKIRNRQITSEEVVRSYINRIKDVQPILNCITEDRFEKALNEAKECDEILRSPDAPSAEILAKEKPFFGVPFTTKDCIAVKDMKSTAGLVARKDIKSDKDADAIRLMRLAGAIPIATTNVSELAMWWESSNCIYGTTKNPYNPRHIVGGSSGGEGCILAAAASACGIGSDIGGSIRMPAFFNGIYGHKPSRGIVSNEGQFPSANTEDQNELLALGPMSKHAADLKPLLKVIAGNKVDILNLDEKVNIADLKFYYMEDDGGGALISLVEPDIKHAMKRVIKYLESAYNIKAKKVEIKKFKKGLSLWFACMSTNNNKDFCYELSNRKGRINVLLEFLKFFTFNSNHTLISLFTAAFEKFNIRFGSALHTRYLKESKELQVEMKKLLGENGIFLYPTHPTAAPLHHEPLIKPFNFSYTATINVLGFPATACPLGLNRDGLPIGIQVISSIYQDRLTLAVAEELQKALDGWVPPPDSSQSNKDK